MEFIGIDLSEACLDVFVPSLGHVQFINDVVGFEQLLKHVKAVDFEAVVVESSGGIERPVAKFLSSNGIAIYTVNPQRARQFAESIGRLEKTDRVDAMVLAEFGPHAASHGEPFTARSESVEMLRALGTRRRQLVRDLSKEKVRSRRSNEFVEDSFSEVIEVLKKHIAQLDARILEVLKSEELNPSFERAMSVPGIGVVVAAHLPVLLPELGKISAKKLAKLVGVAPLASDSGKKSGKRNIRGGRRELRHVLYMAALTAAKHNPVIKEFYDRLRAKGKPPKVALIACVNKLLGILNAMEREQISWEETIAMKS